MKKLKYQMADKDKWICPNCLILCAIEIKRNPENIVWCINNNSMGKCFYNETVTETIKRGGTKMQKTITPYQMAERYIGIKEIDGHLANPLIMAMLKLDNKWPEDDKVPWCSAFMNWIMWHFSLPRSKSLMARSWLNVGESVWIPGVYVFTKSDIVILKRGGGNQPGKEVLNAPGHVGFFDRFDVDNISILAGNQGDKVSIATFPRNRILDIRRV